MGEFGVTPEPVQYATKAIPIVTISEDLVADQFVGSLAHPGGNITVVSILTPELYGVKEGRRSHLPREAAQRQP